jgi:hypothetical protein
MDWGSLASGSVHGVNFQAFELRLDCIEGLEESKIEETV